MKRLLSKAAACVTAVSLAAGMAVTASAEDKYMKLIKADFPGSVENSTDYWYLGDGYFGYNNYDNPKIAEKGMDGIIHIGEDELNEWRESGNFTYEKVDCDFDFTGDEKAVYGTWTARDGWEYICLIDESPLNACWNISILDFDEEKNKLSPAYSVNRQTPEYPYPTEGVHEWAYALNNGYSVARDYVTDGTKTTCTITIYSPDGEKHESSFDFNGDGSNAPCSICIDNTEGSEFIAYLAFPTADHGTEKWDEYSTYDISLYGFRADGSYETLYSVEDMASLSIYAAQNCCIFRYSWGPKVGNLHSYYDGKIYEWEFSKDMDTIYDGSLVVEDETAENGRLIYWFAGLNSKPYGKKTIAHFMNDDKSAYVLIDITTGKILSDVYLYMGTYDGKKYLVKTMDGKWGYMNSKGKLLKTYDDAGDFIGDYAPVVKDGKGFLIDRDLNRVSEKIDADGCTTMSDGLYRFTQGDSYVAVTYIKESAENTKPEETKPEEPEPEESKPEEPKPEESQPEEIKIDEPKPEKVDPDNSSEAGGTSAELPDKANPDTGAAGVTALFAVIAVGASAAVMFRRKK